MKSWVILALSWLIMSLTWTWTLAEMIETAETWMSEEIVSGNDESGQLIDTSFVKNCKSNEWILTNTTIQWDNETKHLVSNITYNEPGQLIYTIHITINDCKNHTYCSGKPDVWVEGIDCNAKNVPENYTAVCNAAKRAGNLELQKEWLTYRYGSELGDVLSLITCINPEVE